MRTRISTHSKLMMASGAQLSHQARTKFETTQNSTFFWSILLYAKTQQIPMSTCHQSKLYYTLCLHRNFCIAIRGANVSL